ncbi:MAG: hypothetical protein J6W64_05235, partial [Bacilli bacterium]|nr:hypothetical protein [Bacilli bacterium]
DGSLTIDEENGTIMSTMLGAGYKDGENRYNGVLIGDVRHAADGAAGTGVYGYHEGVQSFGLNIDGTAFMGKSGQGQIQFDGNSGTVQSMSFKTDGTSMKIDLDDGYIDIRGSKITSVKTPGNTTITAAYDSLLAKRNQNVSEIDTLTAKFLNTNLENINGDMRTLAAAKDKTIARLTNQNKAINAIINLYGNNTTFTYDDLNKNENVANILKNNDISGLSMLFTGTDFFPQYTTTNSKVKIASFDPYLSIISANENNDISLKNQNTELLHVGDGKYFLQTNDYNKKYLTKTENNEQYYVDENGNRTSEANRVEIDSGVRIDLANGKITAYDFQIKATNPYQPYKGSFIELNSNGNPFFKVHYRNSQSPITSVVNNGIDLIKITNDAFLIQSQTWGTDSAGIKHGVQLNLEKGTFRAFDNFNLLATATQNPIFDSTQDPNAGLDPIEDRYYGSSIQLSSSGKPFLKIILQDHNPNEGVSAAIDTIFDKASPYTQSTLMENTLMEVSASNFILHSQDWNYTRQVTNENTKVVTYVKRGIEFNLKRGKITAYGFDLFAYKTDDAGKYVRINTGADTYPFRVEGYAVNPDQPTENISRYTRISWDGTFITNYLKATDAGEIGPFKFDQDAMWTGSKSMNGAGMYLRPDGDGAGFSLGSGKIKMTKAGELTIGNNFKVNSNGSVSVNGGEFTIAANGDVVIKGDLKVTGSISGTPTWKADATTSSGGGIHGSGGGSFGIGGANSGFMTADSAVMNDLTVNNILINDSMKSTTSAEIGGNLLVHGTTEFIGSISGVANIEFPTGVGKFLQVVAYSGGIKSSGY